jgi:hypothetical protein
MADGIFLIGDDGVLIELIDTPYESESVLQALLAQYPAVLAGDQINSAQPRRWLLVGREIGVPAEKDGSGRWAVDHLFVDQDAIPTIVEVKRSSDTRLRREVVGQMLDYAANGVVYWPVEKLRATYEASCAAAGQDADTPLRNLLGSDDTEAFWDDLKRNLQAGRVRMVFVADRIPDELWRVVEFLNVQMDPAEVLAVEVRQFQGQGMKTLVPRVLGRTAESEGRKGTHGRATGEWDEDRFMETLTRTKPEAVEPARQLLEWGRRRMGRIWWGKGTVTGSFIPMLDRHGHKYSLVAAWTSGLLQVQLGYMAERPPFDNARIRDEFRRRLSDIEGVTFPDEALKFPSVALSIFQGPRMAELIEALEWAVQVIEDWSPSEEVAG